VISPTKRVVYDLLIKVAAETTLAIAADSKRLGAPIGITAGGCQKECVSRFL
jgi:hypothetical protein